MFESLQQVVQPWFRTGEASALYCVIVAEWSATGEGGGWVDGPDPASDVPRPSVGTSGRYRCSWVVRIRSQSEQQFVAAAVTQSSVHQSAAEAFSCHDHDDDDDFASGRWCCCQSVKLPVGIRKPVRPSVEVTSTQTSLPNDNTRQQNSSHILNARIMQFQCKNYHLPSRARALPALDLVHYRFLRVSVIDTVDSVF